MRFAGLSLWPIGGLPDTGYKDDMLAPLKFAGVDVILTDIGRGLGLASHKLVSTSRTALNTLAVKSASVTVNFEMTSEAARTKDDLSADLPLIGAKTLSYGTESFDEKQINRCSITLEIVSVITEGESVPPAQKPVTAAPAPQGTVPYKPADPAPQVTVPYKPADPAAEDPLPYKQAAVVVAVLKEGIAKLELAKEVAAPMLGELYGIETMLAEKRLDEAGIGLTQFAAKYSSILNPDH